MDLSPAVDGDSVSMISETDSDTSMSASSLSQMQATLLNRSDISICLMWSSYVDCHRNCSHTDQITSHKLIGSELGKLGGSSKSGAASFLDYAGDSHRGSFTGHGWC
jgi:hypothetical protein